MKISKRLKIILLSAALGICLILIIVPFAVKSYINNNGEELTGRKLELGSLYHNPFTGYTRLRDFKMMEQQDTAVFISFDTLVINLDLYKMIGKTFSISEIRLANPQIQINKLDTIFNYTDLALRFTEESGEAEESEDDSPLNIELKNISLAGGILRFHDLNNRSAVVI